MTTTQKMLPVIDDEEKKGVIKCKWDADYVTDPERRVGKKKKQVMLKSTEVKSLQKVSLKTEFCPTFSFIAIQEREILGNPDSLCVCVSVLSQDSCAGLPCCWRCGAALRTCQVWVSPCTPASSLPGYCSVGHTQNNNYTRSESCLRWHQRFCEENKTSIVEPECDFESLEASSPAFTIVRFVCFVMLDSNPRTIVSFPVWNAERKKANPGRLWSSRSELKVPSRKQWQHGSRSLLTANNMI